MELKDCKTLGDYALCAATLQRKLDKATEALEAQHRKTWALAMECAGKVGEYYSRRCRDEIDLIPCPPIEATKEK